MSEHHKHSLDWLKHYGKKPISEPRLEEIRNRHSPLIDSVLASNPRIVMEIGVGTGCIGHQIQQMTASEETPIGLINIDLEKVFLRSAQGHFPDMKKSLTEHILADTFALPFKTSDHQSGITVVHQGLLEHFNVLNEAGENQILVMLSEQLCVADRVVASVPSAYYAFPIGLIGNEWLATAKEWTSLIAQSGTMKASASYYGDNPGEKYHILLDIQPV